MNAALPTTATVSCLGANRALSPSTIRKVTKPRIPAVSTVVDLSSGVIHCAVRTRTTNARVVPVDN